MVIELDWEAALVWVDDRFEYDELRMIALAPKTEILDYVAFVDWGETGRGTVVVTSATEAREATGLAQAQYASLLGASVRTLRGWEQGRKQPSGAARTLPAIARENPKVVLAVSAQASVRSKWGRVGPMNRDLGDFFIPIDAVCSHCSLNYLTPHEFPQQHRPIPKRAVCKVSMAR